MRREMEASGPEFNRPDTPLIKVCGLTNLEDSRLAVELGGNALGFNFYQGSRRYIEPDAARDIIERLGGTALTVGVLVLNRSATSGIASLDLHSFGFLDALQIHGLQLEVEVPLTPMRVFVAASPEGARRFPNSEVIIDTSWGRGELADWEAVRRLGRPCIISGGLTAQNVVEAIQFLKPAGVDVCSGVESSPGRKDHQKLREFLDRARSGFDLAERG